jgi:glycosyltransferase involved in cell wall biosynthesis
VATTVSAAMIVRDEAARLPAGLASLVGRVDEIVVVDTGSQDATASIAASFGAKVLHHPWTGDFAEARNVGLNAVSSDWVLYIDADETLRMPPGAALGERIEAAAPACFVSFCPRTGFTRYRELRCFRRDGSIRFQGRIHETIIPSLLALSGHAVDSMPRIDVEIDHFGYDSPNQAKLRRNLPLLRQVIDEGGTRLFYWYDLAACLIGLGHVEEALQIAREGLSRIDAAPSGQDAAAASLLRQLLTGHALENDPEAALAISTSGLTQFAADYTLLMMRGQAALATGDAQTAINIATKLRTIDPLKLRYDVLAHDVRIFGELADELMVAALVALGRLGEAARYLAASPPKAG